MAQTNLFTEKIEYTKEEIKYFESFKQSPFYKEEYNAHKKAASITCPHILVRNGCLKVNIPRHSLSPGEYKEYSPEAIKEFQDMKPPEKEKTMETSKRGTIWEWSKNSQRSLRFLFSGITPNIIKKLRLEFLTLTASNKAKLITREVWAKFVKRLSADGIYLELTVLEYHKSGHRHYHILCENADMVIDRWMRFCQLEGLYAERIRQYKGKRRKPGDRYVPLYKHGDGEMNLTLRYLLKYVSKGSSKNTSIKDMKLYGKSRYWVASRKLSSAVLGETKIYLLDEKQANDIKRIFLNCLKRRIPGYQVKTIEIGDGKLTLLSSYLFNPPSELVNYN